MSTEIERKFLLKDDSWRNEVTESSEIEQHYLLNTPETNVRVRKKNKGGKISYLHTIKELIDDGSDTGAKRSKEIENEISEGTFLGLKELSIGSIFKTRNIIPIPDSELSWEVDVFHGNLEGLVVAEVEIPSVDTKVELPDFIGKEVTVDKRFSNANLCSSLVYSDNNRLGLILVENAPSMVLDGAKNYDENPSKKVMRKSSSSFDM